MEWHSSIPLDVLATYCRDCDWDRPIHNVDEAFRVLMIGCGTSRLPEAVLERGPATSITLLDSSATCIEELTQRYKRLESVSCICGDAVKLTNTLSLSQKYQVIVDKGLLDALLCGEGWNGPVATLLDEACKVLSSNGVYLLVSYRLPVSTKEFMTNIGRQIGLTWEFDCEGSNDRVGISVAKKSSYTESAGARLPAPVAPAMRCW